MSGHPQSPLPNYSSYQPTPNNNTMFNNYQLTPPIIDPPSIEEYEKMIKERNEKMLMNNFSLYKNNNIESKTEKLHKIRIGSIIDHDIVNGKEKFSIPNEWLPYLEHYKTSVAFISSDEFEKIGVNESNIDSILRLMRLWDESRLTIKPEEEGQWVYKALDASSEYSPSWTPSNIIGPSNTYPKHGDFTTAWAPKTQNGTIEFLILEFKNYYKISGIQIFETYHPGAIVKISCLPRGKDKYQQGGDSIVNSTIFEANENDWITIYQGKPQQREIPMNSRIFSPYLHPTNFDSKVIKLEMDTTHSNSWSEIDAVKLIGIRSTLPEEKECWVSSIIDFSTEYSGWPATNIIGPSRVYPRYGDIREAWAPSKSHNTVSLEFVILEFPHTLLPTVINVYETFNPGSLIKITGYTTNPKTDPYTSEYVLYTSLANPELEKVSRINSITIGNEFRSIPIKYLKLEMDTSRNLGFYEIDAVKFIGYIC